MVATRHDLEDARQEAHLKALEREAHGKKFDNEDQKRAYVALKTRSALIDNFRKAARHQQLLRLHGDRLIRTQVDQKRVKQVHHILASLPTLEHDILEMYYLEGKRDEAIAMKIFGSSSDSSRRRVNLLRNNQCRLLFRNQWMKLDAV